MLFCARDTSEWQQRLTRPDRQTPPRSHANDVAAVSLGTLTAAVVYRGVARKRTDLCRSALWEQRPRRLRSSSLSVCHIGAWTESTASLPASNFHLPRLDRNDFQVPKFG
ncbi:hypothetical protein EJ03DRAFT_328837 [Teratosphaeria nubilosa]|uniref:Uncharacterized protein n=1 Tax=Teratosphaeria nubilosa TaxID=161662 RepID=A0A6G1L5F1_9PEZI|nr:hypothetical protein EJ03DRAFT_328837 [Teratosphaeria nubilosa]